MIAVTTKLNSPGPELSMLDGVRGPAGQGFITGASGRNWAGCGAEISVPANFPAEDQALSTDPQTSGGLLVSCHPSAVPAVIEVFQRHFFGAVATIGQIGLPMTGQPAGAARLVVR